MHAKRNKLLRSVRVAVQALMLTALTLCFTGFPSVVGVWLQASAGLQLVPVVMSLSLGVFVFWVIVTLLLGRAYCSSVCPVGVLQDLVARLRRKWRYRFFCRSTNLAVGVLVLVLVSALLGYTVVLQLLDPYSQYGRMVSSLLAPSFAGIAVALVTLGVVGWMAWRHGRWYCNTICPVGGALSLVAKVSFFHIEIDTDRCVRCRKCEHVCKSECINVEEGTVDFQRCVLCFNCLTVCPDDAIRYTPDRKQLSTPMFRRVETGKGAAVTAMNRRDFLSLTAAVVTGTLAASCRRAVDPARQAEAAAAGKVPVRQMPAVVPPGAISRSEFLQRCTGCGLCMSRCPSKVMRPAVTAYGFSLPLTPTLVYDSAHCLYECNLCTTVCPTGALQPLSLPQKKLAAIGLAAVATPNCIHCGRCSRVCPTDSITMTPDGRGRPLPVVNPGTCIGCGFCQQVCPATPYKAIIVSGLTD